MLSHTSPGARLRIVSTEHQPSQPSTSEYSVYCSEQYIVATRIASELSKGYYIHIHPVLPAGGPVVSLLRSAGAYVIHPKNAEGEENQTVSGQIFLTRRYATEFVGPNAHGVSDELLKDELCHKVGATLIAEETPQESWMR